MSDEKRCTIKFRVELRSDGGLRIYAVEPTGAYVSSKSANAATQYFERFSAALAVDTLAPKDDCGGLKRESDINWKQVVEKGEGSFVFVLVSQQETERMMRMHEEARDDVEYSLYVGANERPDDIIDLEVSQYRNLSGLKEFWVVHDTGEPDSELEDIIRRQEVPQ